MTPLTHTTRRPPLKTRQDTRSQAVGEKSLDFLKTLREAHGKILPTGIGGEVLSLADALTQAMRRMAACGEKGHKLIFIGNGGSAAIASHQAVDYWKNGGIEAMAFNDASLLTCISNDYGYKRVFSEPIRRFAKAGDLLIAISSSGKSSNILQGVEAAKRLGCEVITFSGFSASNPLRSSGTLNFFVPSHSYGVVEITHLALIHAMLESHMALSPMKPKTKQA